MECSSQWKGLRELFSKLKTKYELETCLYLLEPWEKIVVNFFALSLLGTVTAAAFKMCSD